MEIAASRNKGENNISGSTDQNQGIGNMKTTQELIDNFSKQLEPMGFFPIKISKYPTWISAKLQNGIEIKGNEIKSFKLEMGERIYDAQIEELTKKAVEIFNTKEEKKEEKKELETKKEEVPQQNEQAETLPATKKETVGILPDFFTEELMVKWKTLPGIKRLLDVQRTPSHQVYEVEVGKDNSKSILASYVKGNYMITEANYVFLFDWNYEIVEVSISETGVSVRGIFIGNLDGKIMKKSSVGYQERNKKMDAQQATKAALTDAIKKALSYMGFNRDVYGGEI